ncbi:hypothetical protein F53441_2 [Fusarium austroafricanum]|uniref:PBP domain-containing protein n=1 Tax=Fusarium austroafricanum TaxID=2364996 RepID=A0A8H4P3X1_9HYPO|nr:hypothetical protein F53441_2 [Fusarium austroafricanum]
MKAYLLIIPFLFTCCLAVVPEAVYRGGFDHNKNDSIKLVIANGGAGQSGLIKAITYNEAAEKIAIKQGIAKSPSYYAFRDHFLLVGPKSNPANISKSDDILTIFADLHEAAEGDPTEPPVRFMSQYDKSATNIKETLLWAGISQYVTFPIQALTAAIILQEYTITDRGTILSLEAELRNQTVIYKAGSDGADDLLINPARALVGEKAPNAKEASEFVKWLVSDEGQDVIAGFKKDGEVLYSRALKAKEL